MPWVGWHSAVFEVCDAVEGVLGLLTGDRGTVVILYG